MALAVALLLKLFIVEPYRIPSGSMQPTLFGDPKSRTYDRVLVDKLTYTYRDPERFEIAVFRYPLDRSKTFIKRIVGVGPEELRIHLGDLWRRGGGLDDWQILRRPRAVQEATWKELDPGRDGPPWTLEEAAGTWSSQGRDLLASGPFRARYRPKKGFIKDDYLDGYPAGLVDHVETKPGRGGQYFVGDLRVDGAVRFEPGATALVIELVEGRRTYRFRLPGPAHTGSATIEVEDPDRPGERLSAAAELAPLDPDRTWDFAAQNLDDLLELELNGRTLCSLEIERATDQRSAAWVALEGGGGELEDLTVRRDIFYLTSKADPSGVVIPSGHFYALGDNSQDSSDSREWMLFRYLVDGGPLAPPRLVRGGQRFGENPLYAGAGDPEGPRIRMRDEWGETTWVRASQAKQQEPQAAPFVPRAMILGRAIAVFWPQSPRYDLFRLQWVH